MFYLCTFINGCSMLNDRSIVFQSWVRKEIFNILEKLDKAGFVCRSRLRDWFINKWGNNIRSVIRNFTTMLVYYMAVPIRLLYQSFPTELTIFIVSLLFPLYFFLNPVFYITNNITCKLDLIEETSYSVIFFMFPNKACLLLHLSGLLFNRFPCLLLLSL